LDMNAVHTYLGLGMDALERKGTRPKYINT
jgi:hypothetical protein